MFSRKRYPDTDETKGDKILNNILSDNCVAGKVVFTDGIGRVVHNDEYLAFTHGRDTVFLYSISSASALWSCPYKQVLEVGYRTEHLIVSDSGLVLLFAQPEKIGLNKPYQVLVFSEGTIVGHFTIPGDQPFRVDSVRIINNRIFGITQSNIHRQFLEWDIQGNLVRSITMSNLMNSWGSNFASDKRYILVTAENKGRAEQLPVFLFDTENNTAHELHTNQPDLDAAKLNIDSILLTDKHLIIGSHLKQRTPKYSFDVACEPTVRVIDRTTGHLTGTFRPDLYEGESNGEIRYLAGNTHFIVFLNYLGCSTGDYLYCIDLEKQTIRKIKLIPECVDERILEINLDHSILTLTFPKGYWNYGNATAERCVIDLNKQMEVQKEKGVNYKRYPWYSPFFASNTMVVPDGISNRGCLYFEKYEHLDKPAEESRKSEVRL